MATRKIKRKEKISSLCVGIPEKFFVFNSGAHFFDTKPVMIVKKTCVQNTDPTTIKIIRLVYSMTFVNPLNQSLD